MRGRDDREKEGDWEEWPVAMGDHPSDSAPEMLDEKGNKSVSFIVNLWSFLARSKCVCVNVR